MPRQYFLTDLDGTLLRSDATLSDFTVDVIHRALAEGHVVSFSTARSYVSAKPVVARIRWTYPTVIYNGALIIDPQSERILHSDFLPNDATMSILEQGRQRGLMPLLSGMEADGTERVWHEAFANEGQRQFAASRAGDHRFWHRAPLSLHDDERAIMLTYIAGEGELQDFRDSLAATWDGQIHIHFTRDTYLRDYYFLELAHPQANKQDALKAWAPLVGCSPGDVTVFGDNLNDIGLFRGAGKRIAVANGHDDLKAIADEWIESNDEDGVARYMLGFLGE